MESNVRSFNLGLFIVDLIYVFTLLIVENLLSTETLDTVGTGVIIQSSITFF